MNLMTVIGVVLALVAGIATYGVLKKHNATEEVVVARTYIPPRTQLSASMVGIADVPTSSVPPSAITPDEPSVGHFTTTAIFPGQVLVAGDLAVSNAGASAGLLGDLTPNDRAFSVAVSAASAASGNIVPGDLVDVIVVTNGGGSSGGQSEATTVVQHVEVLGTSNAPTTAAAAPTPVSASQSATSTNSTTSSSSSENTVVYTLALTPAQVQLVALAAGSGTLYLSLDPLNPSVFNGGPATPSNLNGPAPVGPALPNASSSQNNAATSSKG